MPYSLQFVCVLEFISLIFQKSFHILLPFRPSCYGLDTQKFVPISLLYSKNNNNDEWKWEYYYYFY